MDEKLGLFKGEDRPDIKTGWEFYQNGIDFNVSINLDETVKANENFYIGKQWEGINANGLPTPQMNFMKRVVGFIVATITTDNIKINATPMAIFPQVDELIRPAQIVNNEFDALTERLNIPSLVRELTRNAAVDGDGCLYTYWDADAETGQEAKGAIKTELIENSRVFFGNPNDRNVQSQPWIIISRREPIRKIKLRAKRNGISTWPLIQADDDLSMTVDAAKRTNDLVTDLLLLWRDDETETIWAYEFCQQSEVKAAWDTGLRLYPVCWFNWDYVQNCYHGQAMITGLIPNQMFVNRAWAYAALSIMRTAYPKYVFDKTRVKVWDNRVGGAIGINGGDINNVAKAIDPAMISPQVAQFIQLAIEQTEQSLGATSVALGDTRPDNAAAIVSLQRAASTPTELTKQNLYRCVEDLFRIYLDFMAEYYGTRYANVGEERPDNGQFSVDGIPISQPVMFDFSTLKNHPMQLKIDVGASSYYSEIASVDTLNNMLQNKMINRLQYLERIPDVYVPARRALINEIRAEEAQRAAMMAAQQGAMPMGGEAGMPVEDISVGSGYQTEVPTGGGYSDFQRKINETGVIPS